MGRQWTEQQSNAIYATDGSVLVSAAAGSGKTAVLVERVINLITRENNPIDVDRLLIVTFTRAAAAEMKQRISAALSSLLADDPYNTQLLKQKQLLYNASISTIDSFCSEIVREYFHILDISRDFRLADEGELGILRSQALDLTFEKFYADDDGSFSRLADAFSSKGGDIKLRETVLKICEFLSTQPFPDKWLDDMLDNYGDIPIAKTIWGKILIDYTQTAVAHAVNLTENSLKLLCEDEKLQSALLPLFEGDNVFLATLQKKLLGESWDEISNHILSFTVGRLNAPRGYKEHPIKIAVAENRDEVKTTIKDLQGYFSWNETEAKGEISQLQNLVKTLFDVVRAYIESFTALKTKKNILSFADIESLTVKLLATPDSNGYAKTAQAEEIAKRYDFVMVDEFQDVNDVQDLIFKCVSNKEQNLFVVGDVKQSIYGFRQAKPEIFIKRKDEYNRFDKSCPVYPATIILDKNFRSRREVCNTVNFIFKNLMSKQAAQMDYTNDEKLNVGASYPESNSCDFELAIIDKNAFPDFDPTYTEALYIAQKIHKMISDGFLVKDGELMRKATYGDFAIILRSPKKKALTFVNTLNACGIPAYSENKENCFEATEIKIVLNLLRVIDNPTLDIPLLSVMCSPIYGFTPDELAQLRANDRYSNLYSSVKSFSETNKKAYDFLNEIAMLRTFSYTSDVDKLIGKIYETTSFSAITAAVKGGINPTKNLNLLREYARSFSSNGYKSLSEFISYIDKLIENKTELPASSGTDGETLNSVRVLSIHASKGLEFPVCFLADTAHLFNKTDLRDDILIDSKSGLGIKRKVDFCRYNTLPRLAVGIEMEQSLVAEELRVLYVALTRAKEKLIAVSSQKDIDKYLSKLSSKIVFGKIIEPYTVVRCTSISDWLCLCALVHPSMNSLRMKLNGESALFPFDDETVNWHLDIIDKPDMLAVTADSSGESIDLTATDIMIENDYLSVFLERINFKYKNSAIMNLPQKVSASEIAHNSGSNHFDKILAKPAFLSTKDSTAVERGTAHHRFLQHCDFSAARKNISNEIDRLVKKGVLSQKQAEYIDSDKLFELLQNELFTRVINSPMVLREEQFISKIKPSQIYDDFKNIETDAEIIIQGAVDLAFEENGKLIIVDYKTDRIKEPDTLVNLYSKQLELYKSAMAAATELEVSECLICSIHLNKIIST